LSQEIYRDIFVPTEKMNMTFPIKDISTYKQVQNVYIDECIMFSILESSNNSKVRMTAIFVFK